MHNSACSLDELDELELAVAADLREEICAQDDGEALMGQLETLDRDMLQLLMEGLGVREIARTCRIRPATVIERSRHIRSVALGLGICPRASTTSRSGVVMQ